MCHWSQSLALISQSNGNHILLYHLFHYKWGHNLVSSVSSACSSPMKPAFTMFVTSLNSVSTTDSINANSNNYNSYNNRIAVIVIVQDGQI